MPSLLSLRELFLAVAIGEGFQVKRWIEKGFENSNLNLNERGTQQEVKLNCIRVEFQQQIYQLLVALQMVLLVASSVLVLPWW